MNYVIPMLIKTVSNYIHPSYLGWNSRDWLRLPSTCLGEFIILLARSRDERVSSWRYLLNVPLLLTNISFFYDA